MSQSALSATSATSETSAATTQTSLSSSSSSSSLSPGSSSSLISSNSQTRSNTTGDLSSGSADKKASAKKKVSEIDFFTELARKLENEVLEEDREDSQGLGSSSYEHDYIGNTAFNNFIKFLDSEEKNTKDKPENVQVSDFRKSLGTIITKEVQTGEEQKVKYSFPLSEAATKTRLTPGRIVALAGDYYGDRNRPISRTLEDQGKNARPDKEERVRRFDEAYHTLFESKADNQDVEIQQLNAIIDKEKEITVLGITNNVTPNDELIRYVEAIMSEENIESARATSNHPSWWSYLACLSSRYGDLSQINFDHFGIDARFSYRAGHRSALRDIYQITSNTETQQKIKYLKSALTKELFACHFLTDLFSAGHIRTPRWQLYEFVKKQSWVFPTDLVLAGDLAIKMHGLDNAVGFKVRAKSAGIVTKRPNGSSFWSARECKLVFPDRNLTEIEWEAKNKAQQAKVVAKKDIKDSKDAKEVENTASASAVITFEFNRVITSTNACIWYIQDLTNAKFIKIENLENHELSKEQPPVAERYNYIKYFLQEYTRGEAFYVDPNTSTIPDPNITVIKAIKTNLDQIKPESLNKLKNCIMEAFCYEWHILGDYRFFRPEQDVNKFFTVQAVLLALQQIYFTYKEVLQKSEKFSEDDQEKNIKASIDTVLTLVPRVVKSKLSGSLPRLFTVKYNPSNKVTGEIRINTCKGTTCSTSPKLAAKLYARDSLLQDMKANEKRTLTAAESKELLESIKQANTNSRA